MFRINNKQYSEGDFWEQVDIIIKNNISYADYLIEWWDILISSQKCEISKAVIKKLLILHFFHVDYNVTDLEKNTLLNNLELKDIDPMCISKETQLLINDLSWSQYELLIASLKERERIPIDYPNFDIIKWVKENMGQYYYDREEAQYIEDHGYDLICQLNDDCEVTINGYRFEIGD